MKASKFKLTSAEMLSLAILATVCVIVLCVMFMSRSRSEQPSVAIQTDSIVSTLRSRQSNDATSSPTTQTTDRRKRKSSAVDRPKETPQSREYLDETADD